MGVTSYIANSADGIRSLDRSRTTSPDESRNGRCAVAVLVAGQRAAGVFDGKPSVSIRGRIADGICDAASARQGRAAAA
jgi:hypothetical protein